MAAVIAEGFLLLTRQRVDNAIPSGPQAVCVTIDVSGSMAGTKLKEIKAAASRFVDRRDLVRDRVAIVCFSDQARGLWALTKDRDQLLNVISRLSAEGNTNFEDAVYKSEEELNSASEASTVLLFTDGQSTLGSPDAAISRAEQMRARGIRFFAIATGDADEGYLAKLTGKRAHVIPANVGDFDAAFRRAEQMMFGGQLMESTDSDFYGNYSFGQAILRVSVWTAFLCLGIGGLLVVGQNLRLKKPALTARQAMVVVAGSIIAGLVAGLVGQLLYAGFSVIPILNFLGRLIAWATLGAMLARGMVFFIPNLSIEWAWPGGAIGGFLAAIGFQLASSAMGDVGGRFAGAAVLGLCIGLMVGLVEVVCREAWLTVVYGPGETTHVNLGVVPVWLGSGPKDTVYLSGVSERAFVFRLEGGRIHCAEAGKADRTVQPGERFVAGQAKIIVCTPEARYVPIPSTLAAPEFPPAVAQIKPEPPSAASCLRLVLFNGNAIELLAGRTIKAGEIPGLVAGPTDSAVAKVSAHPEKPGMLGLVNLSTSPWTMTSEDGRAKEISPGIAVPLRAGLLFSFGITSGKVA